VILEELRNRVFDWDHILRNCHLGLGLLRGRVIIGVTRDGAQILCVCSRVLGGASIYCTCLLFGSLFDFHRAFCQIQFDLQNSSHSNSV